MATQSYRVGQGANLKLYPRGTKVGDVVELTEAQALYELDMGRLEAVGDTIEAKRPSTMQTPVDLLAASKKAR